MLKTVPFITAAALLLALPAAAQKPQATPAPQPAPPAQASPAPRPPYNFRLISETLNATTPAISFIDRNSMSHRGNRAVAWQLIAYASPTMMANTVTNGGLSRQEIDCRARTSQITYTVVYGQNSEVIAEGAPKAEVLTARPGSTAAVIIDFACGGRDPTPRERSFNSVADAVNYTQTRAATRGKR